MALTALQQPKSDLSPVGLLPVPKKIRRKKRTDLYQDVTDTVIRELEAGRAPWTQPWGRPDIATPLGLPSNGHTKRNYSGINILLLWGAAIETRRTTQVWLTYKQALALAAMLEKARAAQRFVTPIHLSPKRKRCVHKQTEPTHRKLGF